MVVVLLYSVKSSWTFLDFDSLVQEPSHLLISDLSSETRIAAFFPSAAVLMIAP